MKAQQLACENEPEFGRVFYKNIFVCACTPGLATVPEDRDYHSPTDIIGVLFRDP